jgi:hypothetical protein
LISWPHSPNPNAVIFLASEQIDGEFCIENATFKRIMIVTNGSVCSRFAANKGIELARLSEGTVYAVYVISVEYFSSMAVDFVLHVEIKTIQN